MNNRNQPPQQQQKPPRKKFSPKEIDFLVGQAEKRESFLIDQQCEQITAGMSDRKTEPSMAERALRIKHVGEVARTEMQINNQMFEAEEKITSQMSAIISRHRAEMEELKTKENTETSTPQLASVPAHAK